MENIFDLPEVENIPETEETDTPQELLSAQQSSENSVLFYENRAAIENIDHSMEYSRSLIQEAANEFNAVLPEKSNISISELKSLIGPDPNRLTNSEAVETLVRSKILSGNKHLRGIEVSGLVALPDLSGVYSCLERFTERIPEKTFGHHRDVIYWQCFELSGELVTVKKDAVEKLKQRYREFICSQEEKERFDKCQTLVDCLNDLIQKVPDLVHPEKLSFHNLNAWDAEARKFIVLPEFVKYGIK